MGLVEVGGGVVVLRGVGGFEAIGAIVGAGGVVVQLET